MNLATDSARPPLRAQTDEVHHLQQTLLNSADLQGLVLLHRDGSIERAVGSGEPTLGGLAGFALTSFELAEQLGTQSNLGSPAWIMTRVHEGQVIIYKLGGGRLLLALAAHEAQLDPLLELLDACFWRCTPQDAIHRSLQS